MATSAEKATDNFVKFAVVAWALGAFVTLPWSYVSLTKLSHQINKTIASGGAGSVLVNSIVPDSNLCVVTHNAKTNKLHTVSVHNDTCVSCKDAVTLVNDAFFKDDHFALNPRSAGEFLEAVSNLTNWTSPECDAITMDVISNDINRISDLFTEFYVMEKTKVGLFVALLLTYVYLVVTIGIEIGRMAGYPLEWCDYNLMHWIYTTCTFMGFFAFLISFCMSLTREFWASSYARVGLLSTTLPDADAPKHINVPTFDDFDQAYLTTFEGLMISSLVFMIFSFSAHFTLKYGPVVRWSKRLVAQVSGEPTFAAKAGKQAPSFTVVNSGGRVEKVYGASSVTRRTTNMV